MRRRPFLLMVALVLLCGLSWAQAPAEPSVESPAPPPPQRVIYDAHEHVETVAEAAPLLDAMDRVGIRTTCLMGSAKCTITLNPRDGFTGYHENNLELLKIQAKYPGRFLAFPTIDPADPEKLAKLKQYVADGARGLKLYSGHGWSYKIGEGTYYVFHKMPLDDPRMEPVYAYCERIGLPVVMHVNNQRYLDEFDRVLSNHPDMVVVCPHLMLLSRTDNQSLHKLIGLLEAYPNLYTGISFGRVNVVKKGEGFFRLSANPEVYRRFVTAYSDRILYGCDMVVNAGGYKDADWIANMMTGYIDLLEKETFTQFMAPGIEFKGLHLDAETLKRIYAGNFLKLFPPDRDFRERAHE